MSFSEDSKPCREGNTHEKAKREKNEEGQEKLNGHSIGGDDPDQMG